jgi:hypothetical protein
MSLLPLVRIWILVSALATAAGWILSALGALNRTGYALAAGVGLGSLIVFRREWIRGARIPAWPSLVRRFSRPWPLAFAGLAALACLGGALYAPSNYDALAYRLPRVLHWLAQGHWYWIHTADYRMNDRTCGFEWLMAPLLLFTRSDRALFLINFLPFLLMPGLVFSVFTRLGVNRRVAWQWMWLLPTGYCFLLQAGSLGNDAYAAPYVLAAVDFALRASGSKRVPDAWFSVLAAALMTGAKAGNLPLLLPWLAAFFPVAARLLSRPASSVAIVLLALLVSFLPTAVLNQWHCGDWTGLSLETAEMVTPNPFVAIVGNAAMFVISNFVPTFFPFAQWWNHSALTFLPAQLVALARLNFETNFYTVGEIPTEEWAGLGFGISCLLAALALATRLGRGRPNAAAPPLSLRARAVLASPYLSLIFFFSKSGMMAVARLVTPYYPLLVPILLKNPAAAAVMRRRWWRLVVGTALLLALLVLVLSPARPLWPARQIFSSPELHWNHRLLNRIKDVYLVYADRPDPLGRLRDSLPDDCTVLGFVGVCNDIEMSFWRPFGQKRRVIEILPTDTAGWVRNQGIEFGVVSGMFLQQNKLDIETWLKRYDAVLIQSITATITVGVGPKNYYLVRFEEPAANRSDRGHGSEAPAAVP